MSLLPDVNFAECTDNLTSFDQSFKWKEDVCRLSKTGQSYKDAVDTCNKRVQPDMPVCTKTGLCGVPQDSSSEHICRFCYRFVKTNPSHNIIKLVSQSINTYDRNELLDGATGKALYVKIIIIGIKTIKQPASVF